MKNKNIDFSINHSMTLTKFQLNIKVKIFN